MVRVVLVTCLVLIGCGRGADDPVALTSEQEIEALKFSTKFLGKDHRKLEKRVNALEKRLKALEKGGPRPASTPEALASPAPEPH